MKIGILQTGLVPEPLAGEHGEYPSMFERLLNGHGFVFETYSVVRNEFPENVHVCDAWLVTGSAHGVYEPHEFIPPLEDFVRQAYSQGIPMAGICFGHQIMAQALGGKVEKFKGGWGLGTVDYQTVEGKRAVIAFHQDQVIEKPRDASVIASNDFCEFAGLAYGGKAISFQPHPEFNKDYARDLIEYRKGTVFEETLAEKALDSLDEEINSNLIADQIAAFFLAAKAEEAA